MGHTHDETEGHTHIDTEGRFQSDKYPNLKPDLIAVSFQDPLARQALASLALAYNAKDHQLASDIRTRLASVITEEGREGKGR